MDYSTSEELKSKFGLAPTQELAVETVEASNPAELITDPSQIEEEAL